MWRDTVLVAGKDCRAVADADIQGSCAPRFERVRAAFETGAGRSWYRVCDANSAIWVVRASMMPTLPTVPGQTGTPV